MALHGDLKRAVIACEVMQLELQKLAESKLIDFYFLDQGLHRTPNRMPELVQSKIDAADAANTDLIILGYGLCSNGIVGVSSAKAHIVVPLCHDCIALFLGSQAAYQKAFDKRPGSYYLTPGWVAVGKDPLTIMEDEYMPKFGQKNAQWVMGEELKHYTHITYLNSGVGDTERLRERTKKNCQAFNKEYDEMDVGLDFFAKLLHGPYEKPDFAVIEPSQKITADLFY